MSCFGYKGSFLDVLQVHSVTIIQFSHTFIIVKGNLYCKLNENLPMGNWDAL